MAGGAAEAGRSVTSKVTAILMAFENGGSYSLTELAHRASLPISTTHRLVGELSSRRLLERTEDGGYRIGLPLRMIGSGRGDEPPLLELAWDVMSDLSLATGMSARLGVWHGLAIAYAPAGPDGVPPLSFSRAFLAPHSTALGRTLLAFGPAAVVDAVLANIRAAELRPVGAGTRRTSERLRRSLGITRLTRIAVSHGEPGPGAAAVAMPVFGAGGEVLAALDLLVPDARAGLGRARAALMVATGSLSRQLATGDFSPMAAGALTGPREATG